MMGVGSGILTLGAAIKITTGDAKVHFTGKMLYAFPHFFFFENT
jgi:hypothetical protein